MHDGATLAATGQQVDEIVTLKCLRTWFVGRRLDLPFELLRKIYSHLSHRFSEELTPFTLTEGSICVDESGSLPG